MGWIVGAPVRCIGRRYSPPCTKRVSKLHFWGSASFIGLLAYELLAGFPRFSGYTRPVEILQIFSYLFDGRQLRLIFREPLRVSLCDAETASPARTERKPLS